MHLTLAPLMNGIIFSCHLEPKQLIQLIFSQQPHLSLHIKISMSKPAFIALQHVTPTQGQKNDQKN